MSSPDTQFEYYMFWAWQYTKRNRTIHAHCTRLHEIVENLCAGSLLINKSDIQISLSKEKSPKSLSEISYLQRKPTSKELQLLEEAICISKIIDMQLFSYRSIIDQTYTSKTILSSIQISEELPRGTPMPMNYLWDDSVSYLGEITETGQECNNQLVRRKHLGMTMLGVDLSAPHDIAIGKISFLISLLRCMEIGKDSESFSPYTNCANEECEHNDHCNNARLSLIKGYNKFIADKKLASFSTERSSSRALGLWLWDYVQENGGHEKRGTVANALRALHKDVGQNSLDKLGFGDSEDTVFRRLYSKTKKCIESCEVLSLK